MDIITGNITITAATGLDVVVQSPSLLSDLVRGRVEMSALHLVVPPSSLPSLSAVTSTSTLSLIYYD